MAIARQIAGLRKAAEGQGGVRTCGQGLPFDNATGVNYPTEPRRPFERADPLRFVTTLAVWIGIAIITLPSLGCRGIGRYGESRQSIAARRLSRQGHEAMHANQWEIAEGLFTNALDLAKNDDRAHWGLAESLWHRGERQAALRHMEAAVRLSAADPKLISRLGKMYLELGRLEEAKRQSELALEADRELPESWALQGDCLLQAGDHEGALAAYHQALALQPEFPEVQLQVAELYGIQGRYDRLLATLDRLQDNLLDGGCPCRVHLLRGYALQRLDRFEEAKVCYEAGIRTAPDNAEPHLYLAALLLEQGHREAAQAPLRAAIELAPSSPEAIELAHQIRDLTTPVMQVDQIAETPQKIPANEKTARAPGSLELPR